MLNYQWCSISLLLLIAVVGYPCCRTVYCGGAGAEDIQWQIVTKLNYSSTIRRYQNVLLLVTVPWSGESRSLMKELARRVESDQVRFGTLKLVVLYRNSERMLADAIGANEGTTIIFYHSTFSYRYRGNFLVQSILSSVHNVMMLLPEELPLTSLNSPEELKNFLDSTDKSILLLEFCGWIPRLLSKDNTKFESDLDPYGETPRVLVAQDLYDGKGMGNGNFNFSIGYDFQGFSWMSQSTSLNDSFMREAENLTVSSGVSCNLDDFERFKLFLLKFVTIAREFFLPRERHRFAVVHDRSLLPSLNMEVSETWLMTVYFAGCPSCSKILSIGDELRSLLKYPLPVMELEDDSHGIDLTLPGKIPTTLLFVDRSSDSMHVKTESWRALKAFRELAQHYAVPDKINRDTSVWPFNSMKTEQAAVNTQKHTVLQTFPSLQNSGLKKTMSVILLNEGKQLTLDDLVSDLQGSSMNEILTYTMKRKREMKLSSLAKDAGFQLLSSDLDIEVVDSSPTKSVVQLDQISGEPFNDGTVRKSDDTYENHVNAYISRGDHEKKSDSSVADTEESSKSRDSSERFVDDHRLVDLPTDSRQSGVLGKERLLDIDNNIQQTYGGAFYFYDGQCRLLETLTGQSNIPAVVIIDPIMEKHYVLDEQSVFNYTVLSDFVDNFLSGKLLPYKQSAHIDSDPRKTPRPPFVNLDYYEKDSIPLVTTNSFAELVLGKNAVPGSSLRRVDRNILVLFSNSWCGFCQRTELVVREVHRAIIGYGKMKHAKDFIEDGTSNIPLIYRMDCVQNDCGSIVKPITQKELYPLLLLFPAGRQKNAVPYEGDIAVADIIKFLSRHGSRVVDLITDKTDHQDHHSMEELPHDRSLPFEVSKNWLENVDVKHKKMDSRFSIGSRRSPEPSVGCILSSTEMLQNVRPFDDSKILLVKMEQRTGFIGLIINKRISWDMVEDEGLDVLKESPLYFGGPVLNHGMPLVSLTRKFIENQSVEILPEVYFLDQWNTQNSIEGIRVGNLSVYDYLFFLGYSSWGWDQLFVEIAHGAWQISKGKSAQFEWPWT